MVRSAGEALRSLLIPMSGVVPATGIRSMQLQSTSEEYDTAVEKLKSAIEALQVGQGGMPFISSLGYIAR